MSRSILRQLPPCFATIGALLSPSPGLSLGDPSALCREAAADASAETGVPFDVLLAIATVESGRKDQPWPWTVNFGGQGEWYDTAADAASGVDAALRMGATNIDLGCFQLNYRWHASAFSSVDEMLDPARNAIYAAEYLAHHFGETGDWALAAAAYHSATPEYARIYQEKFEATYARLAGDTPPPDQEIILRENRFPLLVAGNPGLNGSLFSAQRGGLPFIGSP
jgi:hypothetical protein